MVDERWGFGGRTRQGCNEPCITSAVVSPNTPARTNQRVRSPPRGSTNGMAAKAPVPIPRSAGRTSRPRITGASTSGILGSCLEGIVRASSWRSVAVFYRITLPADSSIPSNEIPGVEPECPTDDRSDGENCRTNRVDDRSARRPKDPGRVRARRSNEKPNDGENVGITPEAAVVTTDEYRAKGRDHTVDRR